MGFGRKRSWKGERRDDNRKGKSRPKLVLIGVIILAIGILLILYVADVRNFDYVTMIGGISILVGTMLSLFSMGRRNQIRLVKIIDAIRRIFRESCQCCKCNNCGKNHNHWTHDDDDTRRRHY